MATSVRLIRRYTWLIDTIRRAGNISLEEINRKWRLNTSLRRENENHIPERTFHRHREAIERLFGIEIRCDRSNGNVYYIANEDDLLGSSFTNSLLNALSIDNQLMDNPEAAERIIFEGSPGGSEHLSAIIEAITEKVAVDIEYRSYNHSGVKHFIVEPYGLKQSRGRWYMISHIPDFSDLTIFSLDRIESIVLTDMSFDFDKKWNLGSYFNEVIGVNLDDDYSCEEVKIRVYGHQRNYIDSLPLHKTQKLVKREKTYSDYTFRLRPEYEFQHEVLKMGLDAEVLSPLWLRDEIRWQAQEILKLYQPK